MSDTLAEVLDKLSTSAGWEFGVAAFDGYTLTIASGTSRDYVAPVVAFGGVSYFSGALAFSHASVQVAGDLERGVVGRIVSLDDDDVVVRIEAETSAASGRQRFYLVAESAVLLKAL
jgi:hypothetical protein